MHNSASRLAFTGIILALVLAGCTDNTTTNPVPDVPHYLPANAVNPVTLILSDSTALHPSGKAPISFSWVTDRTSTDEFYYGATPDALRDSLAAQLFETGTDHAHTLGPLMLPLGARYYYRVRSLGLNGLSAFTPVAVFTVRFNKPGMLAGR